MVRIALFILMFVWLLCVTATQRKLTEALQMNTYILMQHEEDIRDLQQHVEPKTHLNQYGPYNPYEVPPIQEY